jgi:hypothetical protein
MAVFVQEMNNKQGDDNILTCINIFFLGFALKIIPFKFFLWIQILFIVINS